MSSINWGIGWVDPSNGSDGNNGYGPDTPKATIQDAISDGFTHIRVAAGTHTVSTITSTITLEFMPGTHTFTNAPVTSVNRPLNLISSQYRSPSLNGVGAARITAPTSRNGLFTYDTPNSSLNGGTVRGLWFDLSKVNTGRGAVEFAGSNGVNQMVWEDNVGYRSSYANVYLFNTSETPFEDNSWNRVHRNTSWNAGLFYGSNGSETRNRWTWKDNVAVYPSGNGAHRPYDQRSVRTQGTLFENNTADGATGNAGVFFDRGFDYVVIGNHTANLSSGTFFWADENTSNPGWPMSSHFIHAMGMDSSGGRIRFASSEYPSIGTESYDTTRHIRTDLIDLNDNIT